MNAVQKILDAESRRIQQVKEITKKKEREARGKCALWVGLRDSDSFEKNSKTQLLVLLFVATLTNSFMKMANGR